MKNYDKEKWVENKTQCPSKSSVSRKPIDWVIINNETDNQPASIFVQPVSNWEIDALTIYAHI